MIDQFHQKITKQRLTAIKNSVEGKDTNLIGLYYNIYNVQNDFVDFAEEHVLKGFQEIVIKYIIICFYIFFKVSWYSISAFFYFAHTI